MASNPVTQSVEESSVRAAVKGRFYGIYGLCNSVRLL
jgi:hypothetical protein